MNVWQAELATLSQKGGNFVIQTELNMPSTYIIVKRKKIENETLHNS